MKKAYLGALTLAAAAMLAGGYASKALADGKYGKYAVDDRRSGYTYMEKETKAMQDDDYENPAMIYVDQGEQLWNEVDGKAGKSCASCHKDASDTMKGVATVYPKYDDKLKKLKNLEQQINTCRKERMQAKEWKYESNELLSMTVYVRHQSRGMPMNVSIDDKAAPFFAKGKEFYYQRRGLLDMACKHCHEDNDGKMARANRLSQGQINGFPTYRFKWQKVGSVHRRFRGCNSNIRAAPHAYGSDEYVNLELYTAWRGRGLPVETPSVRN
jgi:sulfur-oxidizing protein SoxA